MGLSTSSDEIEDVPVPPQAASLDDIAAAYPYAHNPSPERRCTCDTDDDRFHGPYCKLRDR